ncbi:MAG: D-alanine--D-alanine ligase [Alphaproteobacteria bacterium]
MTKHVAVLKGGWSAERAVSLISGSSVAAALRARGYRVTEIDVDRHVAARLSEAKPDVAFNALHGRIGEDGAIQGMLEVLGVPYTHSGVLASALAMDKPTAKKIFERAGIRCTEGRVMSRADFRNGEAPTPPFVVKPLNEGSSVGVRVVLEGDNNRPLDDTWDFGDRVLVENYVPGREVTVAVLGDRALGVTEIRSTHRFFDYGAKYEKGEAVHLLPAPLPKNTYDEALDTALSAHVSLGCRGLSRADFRYNDTVGDGALYLMEVNTQPGLTPVSLAPEIAAHAGIDFGDLVEWLVGDAGCGR